MSAINFVFQGAPSGIVSPGSKLYPALGLDSAGNVLYVNTGSGWLPASDTVAKVDLVTQSAAISATTAYAVPANAAGLYSVSFTAKVTTVDGVSSTLGPFQYKYTDLDDSVVVTAPVAAITNITQSTTNTTQAMLSNTFVVNAKASTNIQYVMGYTSNTPGQMIYSLHIRIAYLG